MHTMLLFSFNLDRKATVLLLLVMKVEVVLVRGSRVLLVGRHIRENFKILVDIDRQINTIFQMTIFVCFSI